MTRALITGVTGCVGSNLAAALLRQGVEVVGLCHPSAPTLAIEGLKIRRVTGDLLDLAVPDDAECGLGFPRCCHCG
jgi:nucleoside-diphosphate-sugar epimerase